MASITVDTTAARRKAGSTTAGIGRYALSLTEALRRMQMEDRVEEFALTDEAVVARRLAWSDRRWRLAAALSHLIPFDLERRIGSTDVFIAADHVLPRLRHARSVFVLYDCTYVTAPQTHAPLNRLFLRACMPTFLRTASAVVAISESTRRDAQRIHGLAAEQVAVVYPGVGPEFTRVTEAPTLTTVRERYALPERFVLFVGTLEPRKNLSVVLRALARPELRDVPLVVAGRPGWLVGETESWLDRLAVRVRRIGRVPDADLPALYSLADVFVFPSLYEGFGLPALEAMACGAPVIAANTSSLPEVVGDAGILVPPDDPAQWAGAIAGMWASAERRDAWRARGQSRARGFSWEAAARQFGAICHALL